MIKIRSLKYKTLFSILFVSSISLILGASIFFIYSVRSIKTGMVQEIELAGKLTGESLIIPLVFEDKVEASKSLEYLTNISSVMKVSLYDQNKTVFSEVGAIDFPDQENESIFESGYEYVGNQLYSNQVIIHDDIIYGYLTVICNTEKVDDQIKRSFFFFVISLVIVMFLSYVFASYLQRWLTKPVIDLINHADNVKVSQDYTLKIDKKGHDELSRLYDSFNHMLEKISEHIQKQEEDKAKIEHQNGELINSIQKIERINEELIVAKQKAVESDQLKSAFLANMSHEIRTPMNGILGFTDLLRSPDLSGEDQKDYIEIIHKSGRRMLDTVNDIIDISKIDAGQTMLEKESFNLYDEIVELHEFFEIEARKKDLKFDLQLDLLDPKLVIDNDLAKFTAVLQNLIKNAIKFTDKGYIIIGCIQKDDKILCYVEDSGIGVPEDRQEAIFNRFEQADIYDKNVYEGSGLGLAIAKSYIEIMQGEIWLKSEFGMGSTFFFSFPLRPSENLSDHSEVQDSENIELRDLKLLIAEDDPVSYRHLSIILKDISSDIYHAKDGIEAVEMFNKMGDFDLILMDLKMPQMNGYEAAKMILKINPDSLIIAQTAFASNDEKTKCLSNGFSDYLSKPIDRKKVRNTIQKVMS